MQPAAGAVAGALGAPSKPSEAFSGELETKLKALYNKLSDQVGLLRSHNDSWFGPVPMTASLPGKIATTSPATETRIYNLLEELLTLQSELQDEISRTLRI